MDIDEFYDLLDKFNVDHAILDYNCGGDDTTIYCEVIYDLDGKSVNSYELGSYFEEYAIKHCDLQDASDDYYMGESGTLKIQVVRSFRDRFKNKSGKKKDDYVYDFTFEKKGFMYYREEIINELIIPLKISMINFIKEKVSSIYGGQNWVTVHFKKGITCSEEEENIHNELKEKIKLHCAQFTPQTDIGILSFYNFNTKADDDEIKFLGDGLKVNFINYYDRSEPTS